MRSLEEFLSLEMENGWKVRDCFPIQGHHLVYKVPVEKIGIIHLSEGLAKKSIRNIMMIRGLVIKASPPFRRVYSKKSVIWDNEKSDWAVKWPKQYGRGEYPSDVKDGDAIMYMSYNVSKIRVHGLREPLVVIRDLDVVSTFDIEDIDRVGLHQRAYNCASVS